ncbi:hypothetical protein WA158_008351 [Blastocystis sp. Blastoise]
MTLRYFVIFALFVSLGFAREYREIDFYDCSGNDIRQAQNKTNEELMKICDDTNGCIAFNTLGWLKRACPLMFINTNSNLYILKSIDIPSGKEPKLVIWPKPNNYKNGNETIFIDLKNLKLEASNVNQDIIDAFERFKVMNYDHSELTFNTPFINIFQVSIKNINCPLNEDVDEEYHLSIPSSGNIITIESNCVYGYYHALTTLSQLMQFAPSYHHYIIKQSPWEIEDKPFYSFRSMLIDSSRHFIPVSTIKSILNTMSFYKYNILHWHISDDESFPIEISGIDISATAYSVYERYSIEDVQDIVEFARQRGIRVIPEFDVPGHASIFCKLMPSICPSSTCTTPLDPSKDETFEFIEMMIKSISNVFPDAYFHIGGDEVKTDCWTKTASIADWMNQKGFTVTDTYSYFVNKVYEIVKKYNREAIYWEEVYNNKLNVPKGAIIETWLSNEKKAKSIVNDGYRVIYSTINEWYFPKLFTHWEAFYNTNPLDGIDEEAQQKMVLGGETCMWGETVDTSNIEMTIWPRGIAASERLWTSPSLLNVTEAKERIAYHRCLLNWKGIPASPSFADGRSNPVGPSTCFIQ